MNVEYDRFNVMLVHYKNAKPEYFLLNEIGDFYYGKHISYRWFTFMKRKNGLVYPVQDGQIFFDEIATLKTLAYKNGLKYQIKELKDLKALLELAGAYASIMGAYAAVGSMTFKISINAFRRSGPARLPSRPLPGIGVGIQPQAKIQAAFSKLDGSKTGYKIQVCNDSTVIETPTSRSNIGILTRSAGGGLTDPATKTIWIHESVVNANGAGRRWGTTLNLRQVTAHWDMPLTGADPVRRPQEPAQTFLV